MRVLSATLKTSLMTALVCPVIGWMLIMGSFVVEELLTQTPEITEEWPTSMLAVLMLIFCFVVGFVPSALIGVSIALSSLAFGPRWRIGLVHALAISGPPCIVGYALAARIGDELFWFGVIAFPTLIVAWGLFRDRAGKVLSDAANPAA